MPTEVEQLSPADQSRALVAYAQKKALQADWKAYEKEREEYLEELRATWEQGHNTTAMYRRGCRCSGCKVAYADYMRHYRTYGKQPPVVRPHGVRKYLTEGCRCEKCKTVYRAYLRERQARKRKKIEEEVEASGFPHGTNSGYMRKCRCEKCKKAHADYNRQWDKGKKPTKFGDLKPYQYYQLNQEEIPPRAHGTANGYSHYGCRCWRCKEAKTKQDAEYAKKRLQKIRERRIKEL